MIAPALCVAGYTLQSPRQFIFQSNMLIASLMLWLFGAGAYSINLAPQATPDNVAVLVWAPLAQFVWAGGRVLVNRRYLAED